MKKRDGRITDLEELLGLAPRTGIVPWDDFRRLHSRWAARDDSARQGFKRLRAFALTLGVELGREEAGRERHGPVVFDPKQLAASLPKETASRPKAKKRERHGSALIVTDSRIVVKRIQVMRIRPEEHECKRTS